MSGLAILRRRSSRFRDGAKQNCRLKIWRDNNHIAVPIFILSGAPAFQSKDKGVARPPSGAAATRLAPAPGAYGNGATFPVLADRHPDAPLHRGPAPLEKGGIVRRVDRRSAQA
jgi:hypothetical protein